MKSAAADSRQAGLNGRIASGGVLGETPNKHGGRADSIACQNGILAIYVYVPPACKGEHHAFRVRFVMKTSVLQMFDKAGMLNGIFVLISEEDVIKIQGITCYHVIRKGVKQYKPTTRSH